MSSFKPYAEELITRVGTVECVARAIALISGYTQMETRSLLSGQKDFCAIQLKVIQFNPVNIQWKPLIRDASGVGILSRLTDANYTIQYESLPKLRPD